MEQTLAIIKPDAMANVEEIEAIIEQEGFIILKSHAGLMAKESAETFYAEHSERVNFGELTDFMSSGGIKVLILEKENAIKDFRKLIGATMPEAREIGTIRYIFGTSIMHNAIHGSDSQESFDREYQFMNSIFTICNHF